MAVSKKFEERWNYPNCVGAIDGKHIVIQPPAQCGSLYYNYKHSHPIVLLLVAGADYDCIYVDVGTNSRVSDGGVWNKCSLAQKMNDNSLCLPLPKCLPLGKEEVPYVLIGDDAFALKPNFMKPYAQAGLTDAGRIYNYRHSRARHISENVFGILANRWRLFRSCILLSPETVEELVLATLSLHNFLRKSNSWNIYCPAGLADSENKDGTFAEGSWRRTAAGESMFPLRNQKSGHNPCKTAKQIRDTFKDYFCNEGSVPWQWGKCQMYLRDVKPFLFICIEPDCQAIVLIMKWFMWTYFYSQILFLHFLSLPILLHVVLGYLYIPIIQSFLGPEAKVANFCVEAMITCYSH